MKRALTLFLALLLALSCLSMTSFASGKEVASSASSTSTDGTIVVYMNAFEWAHYSNHLSEFQYIDYVCYHPNTLYGSYPSVAWKESSLGSFSSHRAAIRAYNPNVKFLFVMANTNIEMFESWLQNSATADAFAAQICGIIDAYDFDGFDCDFEFPNNLALKPGFVAFYASMRTRLNAISQRKGRPMTLCMCPPCTSWAWDKFDMNGIAQYVDWFNIMNYDLYIGSLFNHTSHHHTPPFDNWSGCPTGGSVCSDIGLYLSRGIRQDQIVPGCGPYTQKWYTGAGAHAAEGLPGFSNGGTWELENVHYDLIMTHHEKDIGVHGFTKYWDNISKAAYIFNGSIFYTYDDHHSIKFKCELVDWTGCRGLMVFDYCTSDGIDLYRQMKGWFNGADHEHVLSEYSCGYKYCALCGYEQGSHQFGSTYTRDGKSYHKCSICNTEVEVTKVHVWGEWQITTEPGCETEGVKTRYCTEDGCDASETAPVEALGHDMSAAVVTKEATCTTKGVQTATCGRCHKQVNEDIAPLGHDMSAAVVTKEATCTEAGSKKATCARCNQAVVEAIPALGHNWGEWILGADETTETRECARCHVTETRSAYDLTEYWYAQRSLMELGYAVTSDGDVTVDAGTSLTNPMVKYLNKNNVSSLDGFKVEILPEGNIDALTVFWTNMADRYDDVNEWACDQGENGTGTGNYRYGVLRTTQAPGEYTYELVFCDRLDLGWYQYPGEAKDAKFDNICYYAIADGEFWGEKVMGDKEALNIPMNQTITIELFNHFDEEEGGQVLGWIINGVKYYDSTFNNAFVDNNDEFYFGVMAYTQGQGSAKFTLLKIEDWETTWNYGSHTHEYTDWTVTTPATCLETGIETGYCSCGKTEERVIEALGHDWSDWTVDGEKKSRECARCHVIDERFVCDYTLTWEAQRSLIDVEYVVDNEDLIAESANDLTNPMVKFINRFPVSPFDGFNVKIEPVGNVKSLALFLTNDFDMYNDVNEWACDVGELGTGLGNDRFGTLRTVTNEGEYTYTIVLLDNLDLGWHTYPGEAEDGMYDNICYHAIVDGEYWGGKTVGDTEALQIPMNQVLDITLHNEFNEDEGGQVLYWDINGETFFDTSFNTAKFVTDVEGYYFGVLAYTQGTGSCGIKLLEICGDDSTYDYGFVHKHEFLDWTVTTPAGCVTVGIETGTCECGKIETREIPALGHAWGEWVVNGETKTRSCTRCDATETKAAVTDLNDFWYTDANNDNITFAITNEDVAVEQEEGAAGSIALILSKGVVDLDGCKATIIPQGNIDTLAIFWTNTPDAHDEVAETSVANNAMNAFYGPHNGTYAEEENTYAVVLCDFVSLGWFDYDGVNNDGIYDQIMYTAVANGNYWSTKNIAAHILNDATIEIELINRYSEDDGGWVLGFTINGETYFDASNATAYENANDNYNFGVIAYSEDGSAAFILDLIADDDTTADYSKHVHAFGDFVVTVEPTCVKAGEEVATCGCGETETREIPALGHDWGEWVINGETKTRSCTRCDATETKSTAINVNDFWYCTGTDEAITFEVTSGDDIQVVNDITTSGAIAKILSVDTVDLDGCKTILVPEGDIDALSFFWTTDAENYDELNECAVLGLNNPAYSYYGPLYNAYTDGEYTYVITLSDFVDLGWFQYPGVNGDGNYEQIMTSAVSNGSYWATKNADISATPIANDETLEIEAINRYSEDDGGWVLGVAINGDEYYFADIAGAFENANEDFHFGVIAYAANGTVGFTLDFLAGDDTTADYAKHVHTFDNYEITVAPTCTVDGEETGYCVCGETDTRVVPATGHAWGEWVVDGDVMTRECLNACGETQTKHVEFILTDFWACSANDDSITFAGERDTDIEVVSDTAVAGAVAKILSVNTLDLDGCTFTIIPEGDIDTLTFFWTNNFENYDEINECAVLGEGLNSFYGPLYNAYTEDENTFVVSLCDYVDLGWFQYPGTDNDGIYDQVMASVVKGGNYWASKNVEIIEDAIANTDTLEVELINRYSEDDGGWVLGVAINGNEYYFADLANAYEDANEGYHFGVIAYAENGNVAFTLDILDEDETTADFGDIEDEPTVCDHEWGEWVVTTDPTCTAKGEETRTCGKCSNTETREVAALGHNYGAWYVVTPATATTEGLKRRDCARCDAYETDVIPVIVAGEHDIYADVATYNIVTTNAATLNTVRIASGVYATAGEMKNAADLVTLNARAIAGLINAEGNLNYEVEFGGDYTVWYKDNDGSQKLEVINFNAALEVLTDGPIVNIKNLNNVKDFFVANGHQTTYRACKDNLVFQINVAFLNGAKSYTYPNGLTTGEYTLYVRHSDGSADEVLYFNTVATIPVTTGTNGAIKIGNLDGAKVVRIANAACDSVSAMKTAPGYRAFTASMIANRVDGDGVATFMEGISGTYTVFVEYYNAFKVITTITVE